MVDRRKRDADWLVTDEQGTPYGRGAHLAVLMDIRDELKKLNNRLSCWEVTEGFRSIRKNYLYMRKRFPLPNKPPRRKRK